MVAVTFPPDSIDPSTLTLFSKTSVGLALTRSVRLIGVGRRNVIEI
jgi:hypothetical protein